MYVDSPHRNHRFWHKVQIHCHTHESDARRGQTPAAVEAAYRDAGYTSVFLTDHNQVTADPQVSGILHIDGAEYGIGRHHALALGIDRPSDGGRAKTVTACACRYVSERLAHIAEAHKAMPVAAHPNARHFCSWLICPHGCGGGWSPQELTGHAGRYAGLEIFNTNNAARRMWSLNRWDEVLGTGALKTWGFASDDCHDIRDSKTFDRGWTLVNSEIDPNDWKRGHIDPSALRRDILENIRGGNFWAMVRVGWTGGAGALRAGPEIRVSGDLICVAAECPTAAVQFLCGSSARGVSKSAPKDAASGYRLGDWEDYVRVQVAWEFDRGEYLVAFSQPLAIRRRADR